MIRGILCKPVPERAWVYNAAVSDGNYVAARRATFQVGIASSKPP